MKKKQILVLVAIAMVVIAVSSCSSQPVTTTPQVVYIDRPAPGQSARNAAIEAMTPVRTSPAQEPDWKNNVPDSPTTLSFVGSSVRFSRLATARNSAQEDGRRQLVDYYGTLMVNKGRELQATYGISSDVFSPQIASQQLSERLAQNLSQALAARSFYDLYYIDKNNEELVECHVLMQVDKSLVKKVIDDFGQEQRNDYTRRAAAERDAVRKQQLEETAKIFGGNLSSSLGL